MISKSKSIVKWVKSRGSFVLMVLLSIEIAENIQEICLLRLDYFEDW
jgi:hypothetical protein